MLPEGNFLIFSPIFLAENFAASFPNRLGDCSDFFFFKRSIKSFPYSFFFGESLISSFLIIIFGQLLGVAQPLSANLNCFNPTDYLIFLFFGCIPN